MTDLAHITTYQGYDIIHDKQWFTIRDDKLEHYFVDLRSAMNWCNEQFKAKFAKKQ